MKTTKTKQLTAKNLVRAAKANKQESPEKVLVGLMSESDDNIGTLEAHPKQFKTGSRGYHVQGKVVIAGKRYQANILLVEIGSKDA